MLYVILYNKKSTAHFYISEFPRLENKIEIFYGSTRTYVVHVNLIMTTWVHRTWFTCASNCLHLDESGVMNETQNQMDSTSRFTDLQQKVQKMWLQESTTNRVANTHKHKIPPTKAARWRSFKCIIFC